MLTITVPAKEFWDQKNEEFINLPETTLHLEHSLFTISKWEERWRKPFMPKNKEEEEKGKTLEESIDYIRCMTLDVDVNPLIYQCLTEENLKLIRGYTNASMTATTFRDDEKNNNGKQSSEFVTSELVYYWMLKLSIPAEYEHWHLSRLFTLIRIFEEKDGSDKKTNQKELMDNRRRLNELRKKQYHTKG